MANPKHTTHVVMAVVGIAIGGVLAVLTGDATVPMMFAGGTMSALGYWFGAAAQRRHG